MRIELSRDTYNQVFDGKMTHAEASASGAASISGDESVIAEFIAVLDRPEERPTPHIALR